MRLALELGDHGLSSFPNLFINYTKVDVYDEEISICSIVWSVLFPWLSFLIVY